jgi:heme-degrading monooxygenase HmoA
MRHLITFDLRRSFCTAMLSSCGAWASAFFRKSVRNWGFIALFVALNVGCAISPPISGPLIDRSSKKLLVDSSSDVVVALTNAQLIRKERKPFDRSSQEIYKSLESYPGYIGGTIRLELFGDQVWTMTMWESESALKNFVVSARHLNAMYLTNQAMSRFRHLHLKMRADELPLSWDQAEKLLSHEPFIDHKPY